jgi:hypothetical protein
MKRMDARLIIGLLLIAGGIFYLLDNLGLVTWGGLVWAAAALIGGVAFLTIVARDRAMWWALIPGISLLGLAGTIGLGELAPALGDRWGGSLFLGAIGLSFWVVYAFGRANWWALIPGGVLLTLAVVAGLDQFGGIETGGVFFLGLGLTFLLVGVVPTAQGPMRWAFIPGGILLLMGLLLGVGFEAAINYIWPVALIAGGLLLLLRGFRRAG